MKAQLYPTEMQLSFREGVSLQFSDVDDTAVLRWQHLEKEATVGLGTITPGIRAALQRLAAGEATLSTLEELTKEADGFLAVSRLHLYLQKFEKALLICRSVTVAPGASFTLVPSSPRYQFHAFDLSPTQRYCLSRFAYWRRSGTRMILASPLGHAQIVICGPHAAAWLTTLAQPVTYDSFSEGETAVSPETAAALFTLLLQAGALTRVDESGTTAEDQDQALRQWSFPDLLFHTQTRLGRTLGGYGRTYPFLGKAQPLTAVKPHVPAPAISLYRPDIDQLAVADVPFTRVLEQRKSQRAYGQEPITDKQLGEFLFRTARVKQLTEEKPETPANEEQGMTYPLSKRPYPSGGATYPLELYITVDRCQNIEPGFYHYCPLEHRLYQLCARDEKVDALLARGRPNPYAKHNPQVLITLAARFQRIAWKYEAIPYALLLKECGILSMSMHLVATAMGLAGCMVGVGEADLFVELAKTDYYAETCVGEFALGSMPD